MAIFWNEVSPELEISSGSHSQASKRTPLKGQMLAFISLKKKYIIMNLDKVLIKKKHKCTSLKRLNSFVYEQRYTVVSNNPVIYTGWFETHWQEFKGWHRTI